MATTRPTKTVVDCATGIETVEPLSDEEIATWEAIKASNAQAIAEQEAAAQATAALKASAKAKLIAGQPLTPEEAEVLVL